VYPDKKAVEDFMKELLEASANRTDEIDVPDDFISRHPWTVKYLSHFAEADNLLGIAKSGDYRIEHVPEEAHVKKFRETHGIKTRLRYKVSTAVDVPRTRPMFFSFGEQEDGSYIPLSA
jgi:hypothetical protein